MKKIGKGELCQKLYTMLRENGFQVKEETFKSRRGKAIKWRIETASGVVYGENRVTDTMKHKKTVKFVRINNETKCEWR